MPRKSNKPDWPNKNYAFWCKPVGDMPDVVFDRARQMLEYWNVLVACHDQFLTRHDGKRGAARTEAYKADWYPLTKFLHNTVSKHIGLVSDEALFVLDNFSKAVSAGYKNAQAGMPRFKRRLDNIALPFFDRSGGKSVSWFEGNDVKRAVQMHGNGPTRGHFVLRGKTPTLIPLLINRHRLFPAGTLIKRVYLTGTLQRPFGWKWQVVYAVQTPPVEKEPTASACVGLDLGYRVFEDRVRFGFLYDGHRYYELALPLDLTNQRAKKADKRWDVRDVWELEAQIGRAVETCKAKLRALDRSRWPQEARESMSGIAKMREGGLFRLRRMLRDADMAETALEDFAAEHVRLFRKVRHLELQIQQTRNQLYRNLAIGLARSCAVIAWEGDLSLKGLAENAGKKKKARKLKAEETGLQPARTVGDRIEEEAQKWRGHVSLFRLRSFLKEAATKTAATLLDQPSAGTTSTCATCGAEIVTGPDLVLTCANGHRRDQDGTAARNLYGCIDESLRRFALPLDLSLFPEQAVRAIRPVSAAVIDLAA